MHICTVIVHRVNDFFILFFSLLSLPLTHLTLFFSFPFSPINSLSFHQINSLADPSPIVDLLVIGFFSGFFPHRRFVGCLIFFWFFPIADLLVGGLFLLGCSLGCVGSDWLLVSILCGFRLFRWWLCSCLGCFGSMRDDHVWVVLGL